MKKVAITIVDTKTGISQFGVIEEPVKEGYEVDNALRHFGVKRECVNLNHYNEEISVGYIEDTTKVVTIVVIN